jgi:hypothetical protein
MRHYLRAIALWGTLVIPELARGRLCANVNQTPPAGMFLEQVRRVIATQAHRQEYLREPLHIDKIHKYFGKDAWHVIWAQPQHHEMGVFVIAAEGDRLRYVALWENKHLWSSVDFRVVMWRSRSCRVTAEKPCSSTRNSLFPVHTTQHDPKRRSYAFFGQ